MAREGLHITYRRSGGIAGIYLAAECTGADLPEDQAQVASDLIAAGQAGGERAKAEPSPAPCGGPGVDQFTYTVRITRGARGRTFNWSEGTVPDSARPLLATLGGLSEPRRGQ